MHLRHRIPERPALWVRRLLECSRGGCKAAECARAAPHEKVALAEGGVLGLVHHCVDEAVSVWSLALFPESETWVVLVAGVGAGGPVGGVGKVLGGGGVDGDFVVVLEVFADAGEVDEERDLVLFEFGGGADAGQFEDLGGIEDAGGEDDGVAGVGLTDGGFRGGGGPAGVGLVDGLALEVGYAHGDGFLVFALGGFEEDFGDERLGLDSEVFSEGRGLDFGEGVAGGLTEALGGHVYWETEEAELLAVGLGVVEVSLEELDDVLFLTHQFGGFLEDQCHFGGLGDDLRAGVGEVEVAVEAVAFGSGWDVVVLFDGDEMLAHVLCPWVWLDGIEARRDGYLRPGLVAGNLSDIIPVTIIRSRRSHSIMGSAPTHNTSSRVIDPKLLSTSRRIRSNIERSILLPPGQVASLVVDLVVRMVLYEKVPALERIVGGKHPETSNLLVDEIVTVIACFEEEHGVPGFGKIGGEGATSWAGSNDWREEVSVWSREMCFTWASGIDSDDEFDRG